ncbi:MAG: hypothetical protein H6844_19300 [Alphaproteobacteria bacterium]|nr:hypothetical protein [Alphaproteobacteria bacterium]
MARSNRRRTRPARGGRKGPKRGGSNKLVKIVALVALPVMVLGGGGYGFIQRTQIEQISAEYCYPRPQPGANRNLPGLFGQSESERGAAARSGERAGAGLLRDPLSMAGS